MRVELTIGNMMAADIVPYGFLNYLQYDRPPNPVQARQRRGPQCQKRGEQSL